METKKKKKTGEKKITLHSLPNVAVRCPSHSVRAGVRSQTAGAVPCSQRPLPVPPPPPFPPPRSRLRAAGSCRRRQPFFPRCVRENYDNVTSVRRACL